MTDLTHDALVEAVARAICAASGYDPDDGTNNARNWQGFVEPARAALAAVAAAGNAPDGGEMRGTTPLSYASTVLNTAGGEWCEHIAALLRALAGGSDAG